MITGSYQILSTAPPNEQNYVTNINQCVVYRSALISREIVILWNVHNFTVFLCVLVVKILLCEPTKPSANKIKTMARTNRYCWIYA